MDTPRRICIAVSLCCFFLSIGTLVFTKGFLLKRVEVHQNSSCQNLNSNNLLNRKATSRCGLQQHYSRAIVLIVDALRFDFVIKSEKNDKFYLNKLKTVTDLLSSKPKQSLTFRFVADPPTTTMQRLKGLTSGSLPTFVDAGSNFASSEIREDNIISQFNNHSKKVIFMGDDTWMGLFPGHFYRSFPFPSLNVKDLDTVDSGILQKLVPEIENDDFDIIIAHFLGVDHCGHTFGPDHPKMEKKLKQMDVMLKSVISAMPEDCILFLFGDHGMTRTGDHGGDSQNELDAALFVYSHSSITAGNSLSPDHTVRQIDLVPTLSLLLGFPIPFSNLGMVIPELFTRSEDEREQLTELIDALRVNAQQVRTYLQSYVQVSGEFSTKKISELEAKFRIAEGLVESFSESKDRITYESLQKVKDGYVEYLQTARSMCEELWAKFDLTTMISGLFLTVLAMAIGAVTTFICRNTYEQKVTLVPLVINGASVFVSAGLLFLELGFVTTLICLTVYVAFLATCLFLWLKSNKTNKSKYMSLKVRILPCVALAVFLIYLSGSFSNSFVVYDDLVTGFMFQSMTFLHLYIINTKLRNFEDLRLNLSSGVVEPVQRKAKSHSWDIGRIITSPRFLAFVLTMSCCLIIRLTVHTTLCREEQHSCEPPPLLKPLSAITDDQRTFKSLKYFFSVAAVAIIPLGFRKLLQFFGNLNGVTPVALFAGNVLPICFVSVALYWAVLAVPQNLVLPSWSQIIFPQFVYFAVIVFIIGLIYKPLAVHSIYRSEEIPSSAMFSQNDENVVSKMYEHLKLNWRKHLTSSKGQGEGTNGDVETKRKTPLVYGLATVYSAAILSLLAGVSVVCVLLLGDGTSVSVSLYLLAMLCFLELHASLVNLNLDEIERRHLVPWSSVVGWCLLVSHFFYATGHQPTVPSIRFEAAYVGFVGDHSIYAIPSILILINTFSSQILGTIALPLLLFWPHFRGVPILAFDKKKVRGHDHKGEFGLHEKGVWLRSGLFQLAMSYVIVNAAKVLFPMAAAGLHRRHLMVWKIFAPHYIFEGAAFLVTCVVLLLIVLFVLRIDNQLSKWSKSL